MTKYLVTLALFSFSLSAQNAPKSSPELQADAPDVTIHINVNLVQVDAVATDSKNHPVTNLRAEDFEILQDGSPETITRFSYVEEGRPKSKTSPNTNDTPLSHPLGPPQVRRVLAFIVDDLGLSFESTVYVRLAIQQFVDQQMQVGDLVAIFRTGAGIGALQQFTSDKRLLYAAIDRIKFNAFGRVRISSFSPLESSNSTGDLGDRSPAGAVGGKGQGTPEEDRNAQVSYVAGSLGAVRYVVQGLRDIPGRKSVILFSDDMPMGTRPEVIEGLHRLTDAAERSSVVIHTIDARGMGAIRSTANYWRAQDGMSFLAHETGGLFVHDLNDLPGTVRQVLEESSSYYLIGYRPSPETFDPLRGGRKFHSVQIRIRRSGLHVRTRGGFFGYSEHEPESAPTTREAQMSRALASPFSTSDLHLRLTTLFTHQTAGSFITTLLHSDAKGITFHQAADGSYSGSVDLMAALFGDNGQIVGYGDHTYTLRVKPEDYDAVLHNGIVFTEQRMVKEPGAYQLRLVMRDSATQKIGSASQFIEVPDIKKGRLALSGILLKQSTVAVAAAGVLGSNQTPASDAKGNEAVRTFKPGASLAYVYEVLNAQRSPENPPQLFEQIRVYRNGRQVHESAPVRLDFHYQTESTSMMTGGLIHLGPQFAAGDYVMQVIVTDTLAKKAKYRSATQWMDFEVE